MLTNIFAEDVRTIEEEKDLQIRGDKEEKEEKMKLTSVERGAAASTTISCFC